MKKYVATPIFLVDSNRPCKVLLFPRGPNLAQNPFSPRAVRGLAPPEKFEIKKLRNTISSIFWESKSMLSGHRCICFFINITFIFINEIQTDRGKRSCGLHWRTLGEKNATDCGVRGRLLWAAAEKGSGTHL